MPRWVLVPAVVAGLASFAGGALVGARSKAGASAPGRPPMAAPVRAAPAVDAARSPRAGGARRAIPTPAADTAIPSSAAACSGSPSAGADARAVTAGTSSSRAPTRLACRRRSSVSSTSSVPMPMPVLVRPADHSLAPALRAAMWRATAARRQVAA